jgi:hypothetical protein
MRLANALFLLRQHWRFHWASWAVVAMLVCISAMLISLIGSAAVAVTASLREWSATTFPPTVLTVRPRDENFSLFGFQIAVPQATITPEMIAEIAAMPETRAIYPVVPLTFPTSAEASFVGQEFATDAVAAGIDPALLESEIAEGHRFAPVDPNGNEPIPVVISSYFLDLYNLLYSKTIPGAPALSELTVIGYEFDLVLGESVLGGALARGVSRTVRCRIVGLTRNPQLLGITMPREMAEQINQWHSEVSGRPVNPNVPYAFLEVYETGQIDTLQRRLAEMDLVAETQTKWEERAASMEHLLWLTSSALSAVILGLTLFGCACVMILQMAHRRPSLVFLHVSGVPPRTIFRLMLGESGGVVLFASLIGAILAMLLARGLLLWTVSSLPVSVPPPEISAIAALGLGLVVVVLMTGCVGLVALAVLAFQHRQIGRQPVG